MGARQAQATEEQRQATIVAASPGCNRLVAKLNAFSSLSPADEEAVVEMCFDVRPVEAKRDIISEGDKPEHVHVMLEGWAARYKILPDGARQIVAFLLPGDFCDLHVAVLRQMDHGIVALTRVEVAAVPREVIMDLPIQQPRVGLALWRVTMVDEAVLRSWVVSMGRRNACERIAHLLCELHARLAVIGLADGGQFDMPLTQELIADATGLTPVHVNRMLQQLRADSLIVLGGGKVTIPDLPALSKLAGFDPNYLHRERIARNH